MIDRLKEKTQFEMLQRSLKRVFLARDDGAFDALLRALDGLPENDRQKTRI